MSLAALGGGERRPYTRAIALGAVLPDLPMFVFFAWERFAMGVSQRQIWDERYFSYDWQLVFDVFNSLWFRFLVVLLINLSANLVYFRTPTELLTEIEPSEARLRLGGQVVEGSVLENGETLLLTVTDGRESAVVVHNGVVPQLFSEGQGVIVEGTWDGSSFYSDSMLIRHDEQYRTEDNVVYDSVDHELEDS